MQAFIRMWGRATGLAFVVRRSNESKFNSVPTDQALEQSINRDAKTTDGIIGYTRRKATKYSDGL